MTDPGSLIGLTLEQAKARLAQTHQAPPRLVETEPPFLARGYTPQWGAWRVVRACAPNPADEAAGTWELLVTRELVGETRVRAEEGNPTAPLVQDGPGDRNSPGGRPAQPSPGRSGRNARRGRKA